MKKKSKPADILVGKQFEFYKDDKSVIRGQVVAKIQSRYVVRMRNGIHRVVSLSDVAGWIFYK